MGWELPVGTVLAYAGRQSEEDLKEAGWWFCRGQSMRPKEFPELWEAIGTSSGGDGNNQFNLPDYRGRFLRGTSDGHGFDPNAADRQAATSGGAIGDRVGSVQDWATGNPGKKDGALPLPATPRVPFEASVPHLPSSHREFNANEVTGHVMSWWYGTLPFTSDAGGDSETRPANANVQHIIKVKKGAISPVGCVIAYAGLLLAGPEWILCDGAAKKQSAEDALFKVTGNVHGGSGDLFNLPDYRGRFLRGVDAGAARDPDAADRQAAAKGGASGDEVGSVQSYATGKPRKPFVVNLQNMPKFPCKLVEITAPWPNAYWAGVSTPVNLTNKGGDKETRPENAAVDWLIRRAAPKGSADSFLIGAMIAFPGSVDPGDGWLPCTGTSLIPKLQRPLFEVIGTAHGGNGASSFFLPDYRGRFLRGLDRGAKRDPDAGLREQPQNNSGNSGNNIGSVQHWATAKPAKSITASVANLPRTECSDTGYPGVGHDTCRWEPSEDWPVQLDSSGGDDESRPCNAGVVYWILIETPK